MVDRVITVEKKGSISDMSLFSSKTFIFLRFTYFAPESSSH